MLNLLLLRSFLLFVDSTPDSTTAAEWVEIMCEFIDDSINLGAKIYPTLWGLLIFRRILTA